MRRIIPLLMIIMLLCGCESPLNKADTPMDAAVTMKYKLDNGQDKAIFFGENLTGDDTFQMLESIYPYAFSMEFLYYPIGITEISVDVANKQKQRQAALIAGQIAKNEVRGLTTQVDMLAALHDYLILNCKYDVEASEQKNLDGTDSAFTAYGALIDGKAVCSGYARAYMMLCQAVGLDVIYISDEEMNHSWNAVMLDGQVYFIDCTFDDPVPDQGNKVIRKYFLKTKEEFKQSHTWNDEFYDAIIRALYA